MLIALRMKGETAEEMIGAARGLFAAALPFERPDFLFADCCGTGGDGSGLINISTATAFVAASGPHATGNCDLSIFVLTQTDRARSGNDHKSRFA